MSRPIQGWYVTVTRGVKGDQSINEAYPVLTLTQAFAPQQCGTLPSIMDLLAPNCGAREAPTEITAGDLAFLKALYRTNMELIVEMEQSTINDNMMRQFTAPLAAH